MKFPKIVYRSGKSAAEISFPSHKGKYGTCDFLTPICAIECRLSLKKVEIEAYRFFLKNSIDTIVEEMISQAENINANCFAWFVESGDCPKNMTEKITEIMQFLSIFRWHQNGFTRNMALWRNSHEIKNIRLCLTVEDKIEADKLSKYGLVAIPDYSSWRVQIVNNNSIFDCGGGWVSICGQGVVELDGKDSEEDCSICFSEGFGCYSKIENEFSI